MSIEKSIKLFLKYDFWLQNIKIQFLPLCFVITSHSLLVGRIFITFSEQIHNGQVRYQSCLGVPGHLQESDTIQATNLKLTR